MKPNCKINLGLYVTERRPDGYHNLETVFYPIPLRDELTICHADRDELNLVGIPVAGNVEDNLVMRVLRQLREDYDIPPISIRLIKNIPSGAGLGGGSSDAAFMMRLLNEEFSLGMTSEEMEKRVGIMGADCPFFIQNSPVFATGIGNVFTPIALDLSGWNIVLVKPDDFISTREAYAAVTPRRPEISLLRAIQRPVQEWRDLLQNDFEASVFPSHPVVRGIKERLYELGATYACMSGSGSCVYGLFEQLPLDVEQHFQGHFTYSAKL